MTEIYHHCWFHKANILLAAPEELIHMGDVWNTLKRHAKQFELLSASKSQEDSFVAHLDCPPANSPLSCSFHFGAFKIDQHLTSNYLPSSSSSHLSPLPGESWWEHQLNNEDFFSMLDVEPLYLLLFSSTSEMVAPVKR